MANHKSAIKKARMSLRRNVINSRTMAEIRTLEKRLRKQITARDKGESQKTLIEISSRMDKAAQKGRMKRETASRKIGRLSHLVSALA